MNEVTLMRRTFELAEKGRGATWPNPLVGAVIVKEGRIIGEGFHLQYGKDHAEVSALQNCVESPDGATIYVNLEPCCHTNKQTPPCAQRLIQEKINKVVICNLDPNPHVNGNGVKLLRENGIEVVYGTLEEEGEKLNEVFFLSQRQKRPFIHLKLAATLDGKIALPSGESQWITGEQARAHVQELRSQHQVVMVGAGTIRKDNPKLTVRLPNYSRPQPLRVVISGSRNLPQKAHIFNDGLPTLVFRDIDEALKNLYEQKMINILLEGGTVLATEFLRRKLVDRLSLYLNPSVLGSGPSLFYDFGVTKLSERPRLRDVTSTWLGEDLYLTGRF
jgi:diaminohydroxyphosphoribosylaminopyrimidine deaminase / 5-amino-6-(5-phosphoribosylamino)uracil reductase